MLGSFKIFISTPRTINGFTMKAIVVTTTETASRIKYIFLKKDAVPVELADSNLPKDLLSETVAIALASLMIEIDRINEAETAEDTLRFNEMILENEAVILDWTERLASKFLIRSKDAIAVLETLNDLLINRENVADANDVADLVK